MEGLAEFKRLSFVPGFYTLHKKIEFCKEQHQRRSFIYQFSVARALSNLSNLELLGLESGSPPKDIIFRYGGTKYIAEVKTIYWTNKSKKLNGPPFILKSEDYFNSNGKLIKELPKELPEIPSGYDLKKIIDTISIDAYRQFEQNYFNILVLIVEPWWIRRSDIEDALHEVFVRSEDREFAKRPMLNAIVFCGISSPPNHVYNNPSACEINRELKSFIEHEKLR